MSTHLVDADILSYYLVGDKQVGKKFRRYLSIYGHINISAITYYEIKSGLAYKDASSKLIRFEEFVLLNRLVNFSLESLNISAKIYGELMKRGEIIGEADILLAGIAMANNLTLVTNNERHFRRITGLKIENWKK